LAASLRRNMTSVVPMRTCSGPEKLALRIQLDLFSGAETQGEQAQMKCFFGMYRGYGGNITGMQRGKGCCRHVDGKIQR